MTGAVDPGAYVVRSTEATPGGNVVVTVVDMAGTVSHVTVPRSVSLSEILDPVIRHHVTVIRQNVRRW